MEKLCVSVSSVVNHLEELRLPSIPYNNYVKAVCIGVPIAVFVHDTASYWMPTKRQLPIISWFTRSWRQDPESKRTHLRAIRNLLLFGFFMVMRMDHAASAEAQPSDYVEQRILSATSRKHINDQIYKARAEAFLAADEVLGEEEMNMTAAQQQRDAVLRRRYVHDTRLAK